MLTDLQVMDRLRTKFETQGRLAYKSAAILARVAEQEEQVDTFVDGVFETTNTATEGDYIILGTRGEEYVVRSDVAPDKVDLEQLPNSIPAEIDGSSELMEVGFRLYHAPRRLRIFVEVEDGDLPEGEFLASWGNLQRGTPEGEHTFSEAYCVSRQAFHATYTELLASPKGRKRS